MLTKDDFTQVCQTVEDPELYIDIWTLGLIYDFKIEKDGERVWVKMTFTSPFCPYGPQMVDDLKERLQEQGVKDVDVQITFDPPWQPTEELKEILGM